MKTALFLISSLLLLSSCYKDYSVERQSQDFTHAVVIDTTVADSSYFYDMVIDGKREFHITGRNGYTSSIDGMALPTSNNSVIGSMMIEGNTPGANGSIPVFVLYRGAINATSTDTTTTLRKQRVLAAFTPAEYSFTAQPYILSGIWFKWIDRQDKEWRTSWGSGNQNGSSFIIVSSYPVYHSTGGFLIGVVYNSTFNCTLYDNNGKSIRVENGRLRYGMWL